MKYLSVSPIGSSPLQLERVGERGAWPARCTFSIPNRIEPSATRLPGHPVAEGPRLSVSPIGSSPLQPTLPRRYLPYTSLRFQYPQSDRALCNLRFSPTLCMIASETFSIPNRIEPSATETAMRTGMNTFRAFSIPNRIEPSATDSCNNFTASADLTFSIPNRIEPSATGRLHPHSYRPQ
mgnify:CR=1 FL=1